MGRVPRQSRFSFNTQPPEGGCAQQASQIFQSAEWFQHTATRRWLLEVEKQNIDGGLVSTHSHPKVAALYFLDAALRVSLFQHTATRRWLRQTVLYCQTTLGQFQHTATRRWLRTDFEKGAQILKVSTHSHPKVAAMDCLLNHLDFEFQHTATRRWLLMQSLIL